jgi:hypothetical protein
VWCFEKKVAGVFINKSSSLQPRQANNKSVKQNVVMASNKTNEIEKNNLSSEKTHLTMM